MKKIFLVSFLAIFAFAFAFFSSAPAAQASTLAEALSGRILLDVEKNGEAWYVDPFTRERYYLGRPADAFAIMSKLGLGISEVNFQRIAVANIAASGDLPLARQLSGKILLQVERNGEAWYVNPVNLKKYYLGRPLDAFNIMSQLGLGISSANLAKIPQAHKDDSIGGISSYKYGQKISTAAGNFYVDIVEVAMNNVDVEVVSDTAGIEKCASNCPSKPLASFALSDHAFAALNGYSVTAPFYNAISGIMVNGKGAGPLIAIDTNNKIYYYSSAAGFGDVANFEKSQGVKLAAAFGGGPKIVENGKNVFSSFSFTAGQNEKIYRSAFGFKNSEADSNGVTYAYFVVVRSASVSDVARVMEKLGMYYSVLMSSGPSLSLYYNNEYKFGFGSNQFNAVLFVAK